MHFILRESSRLDGGVNLHRKEFLHIGIVHIVGAVVTMLVVVVNIMMLGRCV